MRRELRELKGDEGSLGLYLDGIGKLLNSGYLNALRALGRPTRYNNGKDAAEMASEAAWSAGWNDCLDSLLHFREFYLSDQTSAVPDAPHFNSVESALHKGYLTEEEANGIKSGNTTRPDIKSVTRNIPAIKRPETA